MDRLNQLKQYMDFYKSSGIGTVPTGFSNFGGSASPVPTHGINPDSRAMQWAESQLTADNQYQGQRMQNQPPPDFYGQQPQMAQPQYVQPQMPQDRNPYSGMQPDNGMNGDVTNYLRKLLGGSRPGGMGNSTLGIRG